MLEKHEHKHAVHNFDGIIENRVTTPPTYFTVLYYGLILWGVAFCGYYLFSGWSSQAEFEQKMAAHSGTEVAATAPAQDQGAAATGSVDGAALFTDNCAGCHGAEGKGGFGSDLSSASYKYGKDPESVRTSIAEGRTGKMPAFGDQLSAVEIDALVDFVLTL